jgi:hypothetical protein
MTANEALAATGESKAASLSEALEFLREELAEGGRPANEVKKSAESAGLKWRTVQRAKKQLHVKASKSGLDGGWTWTLPPSVHEERQYVPD